VAHCCAVKCTHSKPYSVAHFCTHCTTHDFANRSPNIISHCHTHFNTIRDANGATFFNTHGLTFGESNRIAHCVSCRRPKRLTDQSTHSDAVDISHGKSNVCSVDSANVGTNGDPNLCPWVLPRRDRRRSNV